MKTAKNEGIEEEDGDNCSICLESLGSTPKGKTLLKTLCNHAFHRNCLQGWFRSGVPGDCCPLCKRKLKISDTFPVSFRAHKIPIRRSDRIRARRDAASTAAAAAVPTPAPNRRRAQVPLVRLPILPPPLAYVPPPVAPAVRRISMPAPSFFRNVQLMVVLTPAILGPHHARIQLRRVPVPVNIPNLNPGP